MGGVWPKQVSTPTRPLTRCYVALRRRYSHVSPEGSDLLSAEIGWARGRVSRSCFRAIDRALGPRARVKNSPLRDLREQAGFGNRGTAWAERGNGWGPPSSRQRRFRAFVNSVREKQAWRHLCAEQNLFFHYCLKVDRINNNGCIDMIEILLFL